ncbi:62e7626d-0f35-4e4a-b9b1-5f30bfcc7997 [Sclerotinia trifoliorum]|uniref:62e7626d-0f35-4e4a-b9b1-5f30bfcc7997 n=1 Tax=Sclerotinia trifoliorum TaxID=28548 RepID=A0A8H2VR67_9HELO|nr:62e7626d-0f35-4e4a-b9b1-5f30bfcc7997 [Sclerotinia trifoliorum]
MSQSNIPIAVIGLACRFPGGIHDAESLWEVLIRGQSTWSDVPADRYNWRSFHHPTRGSTSAHSSRGGYFLKSNVAEFDAGFFGISELEAAAIDPQQRILLEVTYEAMENAGLSIDSVKGSPTGVYVATFTHDYENMMYHDSTSLPKYGMTGVGTAIASNRISYFFDLKGPSISIDTGCSGSLVALHQACQSLRLGETNTSFVGGTNLILSPDTMISMDNLHLLNNSGTCYPFDKRGSGYGRGEGSALIILKRLDDALSAGDSVRAIIRNTAIGQDGRTAGITFPNQHAQESLIRSAYKAISLNPCFTAYVEAHGTGTIAGDITEINALGRVFCENKEHGEPLYVGSVKGTIGHLESGVIPATPGFEDPKDGLNLPKWNIKIPQLPQNWPDNLPRRASLNSFGYGGANAHAIIEAALVDHVGTNGVVSINYHSDHRSRALGGNRLSKTLINGFLNGKVNGKSEKATTRDQAYQIFPLVAKTEGTLRLVADGLRSWVGKNSISDRCAADIAHTLIRRNSNMPWHSSLVVSGAEQLISKLAPKELRLTRVSMASKLDVFYIFTGQGTQWHGMARELNDSSTVFHDSLNTSEKILKSLGSSWSLLEELGRDENTTRIDESMISQPSTTAIQIALVQLLRSLNVTPDRVLGHSSGELAAAYAAGILDHESVLKLSYYRGLLGNYCKRVLCKNGAMLVVGLSGYEILAYIKHIKSGRVSIACFNSPSSTTISGDEGAINELSGILQRFGISSKKLRVDTAYHSHHMEIVAEWYLRSIEDIRFLDPSTSTIFHSSVTGKRKHRGFDAAYWTENLVSKVLFTQALQGLCEQVESDIDSEAISSSCVILEIGPSNALNFSIKQTLTYKKLNSARYTYMSTLKKGCNSQLTFLEAISYLFDSGYPADIASANRLNHLTRRSRVSLLVNLPTYPWDHSVSYWYESQVCKEHRLRTHPYHDLLGIRIPGSPNVQPKWRHILNIESSPWLKDHAVDGRLVFPGAGYLAMAIEAKRQLLLEIEPQRSVHNYIIKDVTFSRFLEIPDRNKSTEVQLSLNSPINGQNGIEEWQEFRVSSTPNSGVTTENCKGLIRIELAHDTPSHGDASDLADFKQEQEHAARVAEQRLMDLENNMYHKLDEKTFYQRLESTGNYWGPSFAVITDFMLGYSEAIGGITVPNVAEMMPGGFIQPHVIHPTTLDALIHSSLVLSTSTQSSTSDVMVPIYIREVVISANVLNNPGQRLSFMTKLKSATSSSISSDVSAFQGTSSQKRSKCVQIREAGFRRTTGSGYCSIGFDPSFCYNLKWGLDLDYSQPELQSKVEKHQSSIVTPDNRTKILNDQAWYYIDTCLDRIDEKDVESKYDMYYEWMVQFKSLKNISPPFEHSKFPVEDVEDLGVDAEAVRRIGTNLKSILSGRIDPLQLLLEHDLLRQIYAKGSGAQQCHHYLSTYVKTLTFKNPNMKVLEVGAGTASATLPLFEELSEDGKLPLRQYDFTDISPWFFENARVLLQRWQSHLCFKTFDFSKDPTEQKFEAGTYDLIIAYNAIHASRAIDESIINLRKLLKTGGRLILLEITRLEPFVNTIFGLLPGWYMDRTDGRKGAPVLSTEQWNVRLLQGGFNGCEFIKHDGNGPSKTMSMIVSKAISLPQEKSTIRTSYLVHDNSGTVRSLLGQKLQKLSFRSSTPHFASQNTDKEAVYVVIDDSFNSSLLSSSPEVISGLLKVIAEARNIFWIIAPRYPPKLSRRSSGLVTGFARGVRSENQAINFVTLDIQGESIEFGELEQKINEIFNASFFRGDSCVDTDYVYRDGKILIPRLKPSRKYQMASLSDVTTRSVLFHQTKKVIQPQRGRSKYDATVQFTATKLSKRKLNPGDTEVKVEAWSVSTEELLASFGNSQPESAYPIVGGFAGTVIGVGRQGCWKVGDKICGWSKAVFANSVRVNTDDVCQYPKSMSLGEAACIPTTFMMAFYALVEIAGMRKGQIVVINHADSPVGHAAIQVARYIGANIIAVITKPEHRRSLIDKYELSNDTIVFPHDVSTYKLAILRLAGIEGPQVILHSSAEEIKFVEESIASLARFGTFIKIGSSNMPSRISTSSDIFGRGISLVSLDLAAISELQPQRMAELMRHIKLMFKEHNSRPIIPVLTMNIGDIDGAVNRIEQEKLAGRIVLEAGDNATVNLALMSPPLIFNHEATYFVLGNSTILTVDMYKFLLSHGARNVLVLFTGSWEEKTKIEKWLAHEESNIRIVSSIDDISGQLHDAPPIRGMIWTELFSTVHPATANGTAAYVQRDFNYIDALMTHINPNNLEFLVIISSSFVFPRARNRSVECAISSSRQAVLASHLNPRTKLIHVDMANLSPISENYHSELEELSLGRGPYSRREMFEILESEMSSTNDNRRYSHIVTGLRESKLTGARKLPLHSPLMKYLPEIWKQEEPSTNAPLNKSTSETTNDSLEDTKNEAQAHRIVQLAVQKKIASMMAVNYELIDVKMAMEDFGLDSLIIFTFRNWIFQNFRANLDVGAITNALSIDDLAFRILSLKNLPRQEQSAQHKHAFEPTNSSRFHAKSHTNLLPKQPLPALEDTLRHYVNAARPFCSNEELERTKQLAEELKIVGGQGQILQARLLERKNDPTIDNWLSDIYLSRRFLRQRASLVATQSYFGTHPNGRAPHTQAERAAIVSLAALKFKQCYESESLPKRELYGQSIDTYAYRYLFNVCREPHLNEDIIREYPNNNYIVVFNNGHGYKISLTKDNEVIAFSDLEAKFEEIIYEPIEQKSWVGTLTADNRDDWAKARNTLLKSNERNKASIETIEAAAFVVCLDNSTPETPSQRFSQFLFGNGSNRWYDKSLQFVVCKNGVSASICEHSVLDGITIEELHEFINEAIISHKPSADTNGKITSQNPDTLEILPLIANPILEARTQHILQNLTRQTSKYKFTHLETQNLHQKFLSEKGLPTQSSIQLAIQLANQRFFNHIPSAMETVSLAQFRHGRVEVHHIITPLMAQFLATNKQILNVHSRELLYEAAKEHAKSLTRASKGRGFSRHLLALQWMVKEGEETPAFFQDVVYARMKPERAVTSCFNTGWLEGGFVYPFPGSILVYFEVKRDSVSFSIFGNGADVERFRELLEIAGGQIRSLLDDY